MAIFHLSMRRVSRDKGHSSGARCRYMLRDGKYAKEEDFREGGAEGLPPWANGSALAFFKAADEWETHKKAELARSIDLALPVELTPEQQKAALLKFLKVSMSVKEGILPHAWAIHDKGDGNPHAHIMFSGRVNDGHERSASEYFAPAGKKNAANGGAKKSQEIRGRDWVEKVRETWAVTANEALKAAGCDVEISHLSNKKLNISAEPGKHLGYLKHEEFKLREEWARLKPRPQPEVSSKIEEEEKTRSETDETALRKRRQREEEEAAARQAQFFAWQEARQKEDEDEDGDNDSQGSSQSRRPKMR